MNGDDLIAKGVMPKNIKLLPKYKTEKQRNAWTAVNNFAVYLTPSFPKCKYRKGRILNSTLTEAKTNDGNA